MRRSVRARRNIYIVIRYVERKCLGAPRAPPLRVNRRGRREERPLGFANLCAFPLVHEQPPVHHLACGPAYDTELRLRDLCQEAKATARSPSSRKLRQSAWLI